MRKDTRIIFTIPFSESNEVIIWCKDNFGPKHRKRWGHNSAWIGHPTTFYIYQEEMAMAFKLRWL